MPIISSFINSMSNLSAVNSTNKINKEIADNNLAYQKENLEYQKALQQQIFDREDTAYQRKVNDLIAAGLNPALAGQGSGSGAGSIVSTSAPQNNFKAVAPSFNFGSLLDTLSSIKQLKGMQIQQDNAKKYGEYIDALKGKVDAETTKITFDNEFFSKSQENKLKQIIYQTDILQKQMEMIDRQAELDRIGYNFSLGNSVINSFKTPNAPLLRELQLKQDMQFLQFQNLQEVLKGNKNKNNAFWWNFGIDSFSKLNNSFGGILKNANYLNMLLGGF